MKSRSVFSTTLALLLAAVLLSCGHSPRHSVGSSVSATTDTASAATWKSSITAADSAVMVEAVEMIRSGQAECVLVKGGHIEAVERGHGVSPLLVMYDSHASEMEGSIVVDKVIGRAAASIAICGKALHVHGELMSEDAVEFLTVNGITSSYKQLVPRILNQNMDGLCPLEQSVEGITDPAAAITALRARVAELSGN